MTSPGPDQASRADAPVDDLVGPARRAHRLTWIGIAVAAALVAASVLIPLWTGWDVVVKGGPPLHGFWDPRFGPGSAPAIAIAVLALVGAAPLAMRLRWGWLLLAALVTGAAWRWILNPTLGAQSFLRSLGWEVDFNWLAQGDTAMYAIILASVWQSAGFYMALMLAGLKGINSEIWSAAKLDGVPLWRVYLEIIIPMMKFTFITCAILLSLGVIKAYDVVVAMTNGGPGQSTWVPAYFTINALSAKSNLGYASAAAVMMLAITFVVFIPLVALTVWQQRKREATR